MNMTESSSAPVAPTPSQRVRAYAVHVYTASGVGLAFLAAAEICAPAPDPRCVFALLFATVLIDATDGVLARRWHVKKWAAAIDGRTIDDIVDYLTYTFLPLLLMARMGWLPDPAAVWVIPALIASLFGFANREAKDESGGFFLGFPSYWNVVAFYAGMFGGQASATITGAITLALALLTVLPVRFLYPNLTPRPWRTIVLVGALLWLAALVGLLVNYPSGPRWPALLSLIYPAFYTILSFVLQRSSRRAVGS
ncbi:MAG: phosphatidylcholine synthase [Chthoniobacter sp.]|nr:phosphatidylcholine synthase [Chthoniobacter sp.]